ncbi:4'-phosphopantetheinyl transferase [Kitasatospora sp. SolWspMP-SS2h]|uniref:4'-phosphopantetheinyl transferase family protein n=1 Tax=Kitasatospora sp. SolWspMP-SS2h TaxID=1305729 RepID=UPI000DBAAEFA|nr:4'-phosphopantetheinyl transferase superfamily protein [Kitasatospora sp. SolWspMP-SS2h]RAJ38453.1 4'-phosphopantetheinyl transferase [Kitasatospora sp. SolWspMP-SS2h]
MTAPRPDHRPPDHRPPGHWPPGPAAPVLAPGEVHVWRARLDLPAPAARRYADLLDAGERARAADCRLPLERARHVAAHGALRTVLARYTGRAPADLRLHRTARGRPRLAPAPDTAPDTAGLDFNLSHSGGLALIAVTRTGTVGVDLELVRTDLDHRAMAARFLDPADARLIAALPPAAGRHAFFTRWTWREAYAKAADVPVPRRLSTGAQDPTAITVGRWKLSNLPLDKGYCATVAASEPCAPAHRWTLTQDRARRTTPTRSA